MRCRLNSRFECYGCGICEKKLPKCPICGEEADKFIKNNMGEIVGCENCTSEVESYVS